MHASARVPAASPRVKKMSVEIPAGIHDGQRIRLAGEGHAGANGGPAGDAYVEVRVRPDERLERDGNDIVTTIDLTIVEAARGAKMPVPTLEGDSSSTSGRARSPAR